MIGMDAETGNLDEKVLARCRCLLDEGLERARCASLYESPGDLLFLATAMVVALLNHGAGTPPQGALRFSAKVVGENDEVLCRWDTGDGRAKWPRTGPDLRCTLDHGMELHATLAMLNESGPGECSNWQGLREEIMGRWQIVAEEKGVEFFIGQHDRVACARERDEWGDVETVHRTLTARLREGLQRLEEELPHELRVAYTEERGVVPSQLFFIRDMAPMQPDTEDDAPIPGYLLTHEDLRILQSWIAEGKAALRARIEDAARALGYLESHGEGSGRGAAKAIVAFLDQIECRDEMACLALLRRTLEQPLTCLGSSHPLARALQGGAPGIQGGQGSDISDGDGLPRASGEVLAAVLGLALWNAQPRGRAGEARHLVFWPVPVLGRPVLALQTAFACGNPLYSEDPESFAAFQNLVQCLYRISAAGWNLFFDLYCEVFMERFTTIYLDFIRERMGRKRSIELLDGTDPEPWERILTGIIQRLNNVTGTLCRLLNIHAVTWELAPCGTEERESSLWHFQALMAATEDGRSPVDIEDTEEMRLLRLANEEGSLERMLMCPETTASNRPEIEFMCQHLAWRLGHHIRYTLPVWMMSMDYGKLHGVIRRQRMLRHELGHLFNSAHDMVLRMDCEHGTLRDDLKLMLGLAQRTMSQIDGATRVEHPQHAETAGGRQVKAQPLMIILPPRRFIPVAPLLAMIRRNFSYAFSLESGICRFHMLAPETLRAWITEEDFIILWKNLWSNARKALIDYSRDTPLPGLHHDRQQEIIHTCRPFTDRFSGAEPPQPMLLALFYDRNTEAGRCLFMDILDNAPRLKGGPMSYPECVRPGHYGLRVVNDIIEQLGEPAEFEIVHALTSDCARSYMQFEALRGYNWDVSVWTRTSIKIKAEWG